MKIAVIESTSKGVNYHRLANPLSYIDHKVTKYNTIPLDKVKEVDCDVVIFSRFMYEPEQLKIIRKFKHRGTKVIVDVDDYWVLPQNHVGYHGHKVNGVTSKIVEAIQHADEVWTTHGKLADKIRKHNTKVRVYPNALDPTDEQWHPNPTKSDNFRVGFVGGITHGHDLYETVKAWRSNDVEAVLCGVSEHKVFNTYNYIMSGNGTKKIRVLSMLDVHSYGLFYDHMDISIAPLTDTTFNKMKSNLKIIESGMKATPIICSWMHPYIDDHEGIYKTDNWRKAFAKVSKMGAAKMYDQGQELREYVLQNYDIRNHKREL
jgi:hypothetical protein